jgi:hypothetical protein
MQANDDPLLEAVRGLGHFEKLRSTFPSHEIREVIAHHVRDVGVAGSNPATPTNKFKCIRPKTLKPPCPRCVRNRNGGSTHEDAGPK